MNFSKFASDLEISAPTVREYFSILEDTLIGEIILPWKVYAGRKARAAGKFYFFDPGVTHTLSGTKSLDPNSSLLGQAFEQWVFMELTAWNSYSRSGEQISFWRHDEKLEVDFLVGSRLAVDANATTKLRAEDFKGLMRLSEVGDFQTKIIVSQDPIRREHQGILCLPYRDVISWLWSRK